MSKCQTTVCSECPYRKSSPPGYFGGNDPAAYREAIISDVVVACHTRNRYNEQGYVDTTNLQPCIGHLTAQTKSCKRSRVPEVAELQHHLRDIVDQSNILNLWEFDAHHAVDQSADM